MLALSSMSEKYEIIVVGAGISGAVLAERYANVLGKRVLVLETRNHIAGNCHDYYNEHGILVSKYGAHLFHTSFEDVWEYVNQFSEWLPYEHRVLCHVDGRLVPLPVNIKTVNILFRENLKNEKEMKDWLKNNVRKISRPKNSEESALARMGHVIYETLFKQYTKKQWDLWPHELEASVLERIPVRTNFDDRYFSDTHQAQPKEGYTEMFKKMLSHKNITVLLNTDYFDINYKLKGFEKLFFTGPIDKFFSEGYDRLQYRSLRFEFTTYNEEYFQENSVINYPSDYDFIRIVEFKHMTGQKHPKTTVSREYPTWEGEPYYPVPSQRNKNLYEMYKKEAEVLEKDGIYFVGRLANYKYFNMDQAFKNSLDLFKRLNPMVK
jgi:UDP-galactopyranose mutase